MPIPSHIIAHLATQSLKLYEWKVLMSILADSYDGNGGSEGVDFSLPDLSQKTGISKQHVCRTLGSLEKRGIIAKVKMMGETMICFLPDYKEWRES